MNTSEAMQHALGYAAGREDASVVRTVSPTDAPGLLTFAEAYARAWAEYHSGARGYMTNCRSAYETWQASAGRTIFRDEMTAREGTAIGPVSVAG